VRADASSNILPASWVGDSEMGHRTHAFDWSQTPLGPIETWPSTLRSVVAVCLGSPFQMAVYWGPELSCIYNDAERDILGKLHPIALGLPARELLRDSWDVVGPQLMAAMQRGESVRCEDEPLTFDRRGQLEVGYFTYSYSPVLDDDGQIGGVLLVSQDTTARVLSERRMNALRELTVRSTDALTEVAACEQAIDAVTTVPDVTFALAYLVDEGNRVARCVAASGACNGNVPVIALAELSGPAPARARPPGGSVPGTVIDAGRVLIEADAVGRTRPRAFVTPIRQDVTATARGFLVAGLSDELMFDAPYQQFLEMAAAGVARSMSGAAAREAERARGLEEERARVRTEERMRREAELRQLVRDLRAARRRVAAAGDRERRRIERDLHDGAQQQLTAIQLDLGALPELLARDVGAAAARIKELRVRFDEALEDLRELAHGVYPPLLSSDGLYAALSAAARRCPVPTTVGPGPIVRAPRSIESAAYFCCLEALQNVAKHAGPGARASISLRTTGDVLEFRVSDDGVGFDPAAMRPGHGLINMKDRLNDLVEVRSAPGQGTTVIGRLPLP
jgi:signal transduction histidine kinase